MEPEINCSELCDSFPGQELDRRPLHDLCKTTITSSHHSSKTISSLSPVLLGIVWTFLSCGLLLILFFLAFTIRCRKNRIVKMSSPNLNIVTLLGSCLTYSSAYLFGIQDVLVGSSMETLIQTRLSMLCIGTSLVFGPILGKSWRLYKVFTQRVPDKRVIIKDLQLLGLVAALLMADVILLMTWVLTDPIQCLQILSVSMTVTGKDVSCTSTSTHFCASRYSDVWIALVWGCKLKQWKAFEEENQTIRRMAKYFSTPSKSFHTQYGEEENCHPRGEKSSMERLLTEKNAVIESLQEQVNNAKEKIVRLMSAECTYDLPEGAAPPASSLSKDVQAVASVHTLAAAQGPSGHLSDFQNDPGMAARDSQCTSGPSSYAQSLEGPGKDSSFSPGKEEKISDSKDFSDHLDSGCSQKPWTEQSLGAERGDQVPMDPSQSLLPDRGGSDPQRQRHLENSEEPPERRSQVSSVIREKLQEVLQDLGLGPEASLSTAPSCHQQTWKNSAAFSPQKMPLSKELGFSPYMVRRRAAQRARSHFPGSASSSVGHRANRTVPGAHSRLHVQNGDSPSLAPQTTDSRVRSPSSRKPSLPSDPQDRPGTLEGSKQSQTEPEGARGSKAAFLPQPSGSGRAPSPAAPCLSKASPDLPEQWQLWPPVPSGCPSLSSEHSYFDTESSSSDEFFCRCHRPYCEICFQSSSDSSDSGTSDTDPEPTGGLASWEKLWACSKPIVNFKDDLKPTLV
ncbi:probable G-protein coupled receptor 156 isoform X4 [Gorilla gorilla gorilla]|uniref:probable G-protein coupled receptor 156 isoform X4 n=1 Tax=Gorilla gorilla gorilla TaxID=9595 RepID=UPI00244606C7|nr:probable G-protein coupled receptor 156 isoform X4 [Gorilla gorilla gorilla]